MKHYAIVIKDSEVSEHGFRQLNQSSMKVKNDFTIERFNAVVPSQVDDLLLKYDIQWNYPWNGEVIDFASGLTKKAYPTANPKARIAAALSHYTLWNECAILNQPFLILEHDAYFVNKIDFDPSETSHHVIGINNPLGATRKSRAFHELVLKNINKFQPVPTIDEPNVPQGLAGNSAYIIKPAGAERLIDLVKEYGLWPNDAIMCKQLMLKLGVTRKFYTNLQNLRSTTTL